MTVPDRVLLLLLVVAPLCVSAYENCTIAHTCSILPGGSDRVLYVSLRWTMIGWSSVAALFTSFRFAMVLRDKLVTKSLAKLARSDAQLQVLAGLFLCVVFEGLEWIDVVGVEVRYIFFLSRVFFLPCIFPASSDLAAPCLSNFVCCVRLVSEHHVPVGADHYVCDSQPGRPVQHGSRGSVLHSHPLKIPRTEQAREARSIHYCSLVVFVLTAVTIVWNLAANSALGLTLSVACHRRSVWHHGGGGAAGLRHGCVETVSERAGPSRHVAG